MAPHRLRQRDPRAHQHGGPDDAVEARDVLADDVQVARPVALHETVGITREFERRDVVDERVEPHVHGVTRVDGQRNAPLRTGTRDRDVFQAALDDRHDLVASDLGLNEAGIRPDVLAQAIGKA